MNAPIIVSAVFAPADHRWLDGLRKTHFPPERNLIEAHLTLFHHLAPSLLAEIDTRLRAAVHRRAPEAAIDGPMNLGRGTALRVRCPDLVAIRADLADAFAGSLTPQDQAGWRPHVTIQNKVEPAEARRLNAEMAAGPWPRPLAIRGLVAWWYRGGPWEPIREYRFR